MKPISRRAFLSTATAAAGGLALSCDHSSLVAPPLGQRRPGTLASLSPESSGIDHVVVVMMENRSFDHFLGWLPGADGHQGGLTYFDATGTGHATHRLAPDFQGCGHAMPDHSYEGGRVEYDGGACDGWLRANDDFSIGYYEAADLAFFGQAAPQWTTFDRYFCAIMAETFPNRVYQHAGQTDRLHNTDLVVSTLPTIWDRLGARGLRGRYYFGDVPFLGLWGARYVPISRPLDAFFTACAAGTLPDVAFVDNAFVTELTGTGSDDHPYNDIRAGEAFLNRVYAAVTSSPQWANTALVINFDEWGGFFDHVPPPVAPISAGDIAVGNVDGLRGFRTPTLVISPFARRAHISHVVYDHTSVLRMIEWRWNLAPLTIRDATANNLADELDFGNPQLAAPAYAVPPVVPVACPMTVSLPTLLSATWRGSTHVRSHWSALGELARRHGWSV